MTASKEKHWTEALQVFELAQGKQKTEEVKLQIEKVKAQMEKSRAAAALLTETRATLVRGEFSKVVVLAQQGIKDFGDTDEAKEFASLRLEAETKLATTSSGRLKRAEELEKQGDEAKKAGDLRSAQSAWQTADELFSSPALQRKLAAVGETLKRYDEAVATGKKLLEDGRARKDKTKCLEAARRFAEAKTVWANSEVDPLIAEANTAATAIKDTIAIVDFQVQGDVGVADAGKIVPRLLLSEFAEKFELVTRTQLETVLREKNLQFTDLMTADKALEKAKLLPVKYLVVGEVMKGAEFWITAQLVEIGSGIIRSPRKVSAGSYGDLEAKIPTLAKLLLATASTITPSSSPTRPQLVVLPSASKDKPWTNSLGMKFVPVPSSSVLFCIWETRVQDYQTFVNMTGRPWQKPDFEQGPTHPAVMVSWGSAKAFCQWLTEKERKERRLSEGQCYRLPTDAEWSAAVGGHRYPWGDQWPPPRGAGNYYDVTARKKDHINEKYYRNSGLTDYDDGYAQTAPVGSFKPNEFGLYDLGGNVWEWCENRGANFITRGASWSHRDPNLLLSSSHDIIRGVEAGYNKGFRLVLAGASSPPFPEDSTAKITAPLSSFAVPEPVALLAASTEKTWTNSLGMKFVPVPRTQVMFCIWQTRVCDYAAYANANRNVDRSWQNLTCGGVPVSNGPDHPVVEVSWRDAKEFCQWLTQKERSAGLIGPNQSYRLPTDLEWSAAAGLGNESGSTPNERSGEVRSAFPWGTQWPPPRGAGNYADQTFKARFSNNEGSIEDYNDGYATTAPVGNFAANQFGLFDLGGNVQEWCEDWYNPDKTHTVVRGNSWAEFYPEDLLSSHRHNSDYGVRCVYFGFRVVLAGEFPR